MARDKRVTSHKLARAEGALTELLECADVELERPLRLALKAVALNREWLAATRAEGGEGEDDVDEAVETQRQLAAVAVDAPGGAVSHG
jgi:hypothetical protein